MRKFEPEPAAASTNPLVTVGGLVGAAGGWALASYTGASLWIPSIAAGLLALLFAKTPLAPSRFRGAIAVTGGHIVWFIAAGALTGAWELIGLDIVALSVAIAVLWVRPSQATALLLGGLQLASLGYNVYRFVDMPFGSPDHRAMTVHVLFRVLAIAFVILGILALRREVGSGPEKPDPDAT
jgi:hypothetical protein